MRLVYGRQALEAEVGSNTIKKVQCWRKFPNDKKSKPRADWWPYCYKTKEGEWVVACEETDKLRKTARWSALERGVGAAKTWASKSAPVAPLSPVFTPGDWSDFKPTTLALDIEGTLGSVTRISLATDNQCGTFSWDEVSKQLTMVLASKARKILGWNLGYDRMCLEEEGVRLYTKKCVDLMTIHNTLNPWRFSLLGHAAPLYAPLEPWKHFDKMDVEEYAIRDAFNLIPIYHTMLEQLKVRRQLKHAMDLDMPAYFRLYKIGSENVETNRGSVKRRFVARRRGKQSPETVSSWLMESNPPIGLPGSPEGKKALELDERYFIYRIREPYRRIISSLVGEPIVCDDHILRRIMGYGPDQVWRGSPPNGLPPLPTKKTKSQLKQEFLAFTGKHPKVLQWMIRLDRQNAKDKYVVNPFGRRCYDTQKPQRWVVESTLADTIRLGLGVFPQTPVHLVTDGWVFRNPVDVAAYLETISFPLESLKRNIIGGLT